MAKTRSELREKAMVILYQIDILKSNKCEYNVENLITENLEVDNEFVRNLVYGVETHLEQLDEMANKTVATAVVPYPPGIPLLMPGENAGSLDGKLLKYLKALEAFDKKFAGFTHDTHGVEVDETGTYRVLCLKK